MTAACMAHSPADPVQYPSGHRYGRDAGHAVPAPPMVRFAGAADPAGPGVADFPKAGVFGTGAVGEVIAGAGLPGVFRPGAVPVQPAARRQAARRRAMTARGRNRFIHPYSAAER